MYSDDRMFVLKIELVDSNPKVFREFVVPGKITLDRLHDVIQVVMGWGDSHLHEFQIGKNRYTEWPDPEFGKQVKMSGKFHLENLAKKRGRTFQYMYDFGDSWEHLITIEHSNMAPEEFPLPVFCLEGEGNCPPEDVGGIPGYEHFLKVMADPKHPEYEGMKTWVASRFKTFNLDKTNMELAKYLRWSRDRQVFWNEIS